MTRYIRASLLSAAVAACTALSAAGANAAGTIPSGEPVDGIRCDASEGAVMHIHQHVAIRDHGKPVRIPDDVGRPLIGQCFYWLHTHTPDGIVHIEAPTFRSFSLGNFFDVWGQPLSRTDVAGAKPKPGEHVMVWVGGRPYLGDPRKIELVEHLDVTIEVGPPYAKPSPFDAWDGN